MKIKVKVGNDPEKGQLVAYLIHIYIHMAYFLHFDFSCVVYGAYILFGHTKPVHFILVLI